MQFSCPGGVTDYTGGLPVVLTPLNGNYSKGASQLQWSSLQESNSNYFEIQRSIDGVNFAKIGQIKAKGSSDVEVDYSYKDVSSIAGINFYRLKLIDNDGAFQYSNIEAINVNIKGIKITGNYPGPFTNEVNINISSALVTPAVIFLLDGNGKILLSQQTVLSKGINRTSFNNLGNLHNGIYFIKIQAGNISATEKIIK